MTARTLITGPSIEPVTVEEARLMLRQDETADDTLIAGLVRAAREYCERFTGRALITQTWDMVLDGWPIGIVFPLAPLQSVSSVKYTDESAVEHTYAATNYHVDATCEPGRLVWDDDSALPSDTLADVAAIRVRFVCGYGTEAGDVPEMIRLAMKILVGQLYENREAPNTTVADALLWPYRLMGF